MLHAYVTTAVSGGIATVEFATPAHNSLPGAQLRQLTQEIDRCSGDPLVRAVVLRSGGERTFCAGASFDELVAVDSEAAGLAFFAGFAAVINAMRRCTKPIIGRVQGKAVGGGVGLIAACDLAYATDFASVRLSELAIGIGPFVIGPAVERKVGTTAFAELSWRADEWFDAAFAKRRGLYSEVLATTEELDRAVFAKAKTLAGFHTEAVAEMKRALWRGTEHWDKLLAERAAISGRLVTREFTRKTLAKLTAKK